jgi:uncharacterized integral membrane protein
MSDAEINQEAPPAAKNVDPRADQSDPGSASVSPVGHEPATAEPRGAGRMARHKVERNRHTRISGAWAAVFVGVILGVALIDFIVENTRSLRVDFFSASGRMPAAVALLAAALAGAAVVLVVGVCRTAQLRLSLRRHRQQSSTDQAAQSQMGAVAEAAQR